MNFRIQTKGIKQNVQTAACHSYETIWTYGNTSQMYLKWCIAARILFPWGYIWKACPISCSFVTRCGCLWCIETGIVRFVWPLPASALYVWGQLNKLIGTCIRRVEIMFSVMVLEILPSHVTPLMRDRVRVGLSTYMYIKSADFSLMGVPPLLRDLFCLAEWLVMEAYSLVKKANCWISSHFAERCKEVRQEAQKTRVHGSGV